MVLPRVQPGAPPHHLAVQAPYLCRAQHHDAVHRRAVPPLRQQHGVAQHVITAAPKGFQHFRTVAAVPVHFRGPEPFRVQDVPELLARLHERQEHHCLPVHAVRRHLVRDMVQVRVQGRADVAGLEVPGLDSHACQVQLQRYGQRLDGAQVSGSDRSRKRILICQRLEELPKAAHVAPVRGGGDAQHPRILEMPQDPLVAVRQAVVRLVDYDGAEIVCRELPKALLPRERLDGPDRDAEPAAEAGLLRLFGGASKPGRPADFVRRLLQELAAVGQDEHPVAAADAVLRHFREDDGLPASCRKDQQGTLYALPPFGEDALLRLLLILSQLHQKSPALYAGALGAASSFA